MFPGAKSPEAPRRDRRPRSCSARPSSLCQHELPAASVCRWWRGVGRTLGLAAPGEGPGARSPPAGGSGVLAPTARPPSRVAQGRTREPVLQRLASLSATPSRAPKGEDGAGTPGRPRDRRPHPRPGLRRSARLPHLALHRVCLASPRVSARPGRGRRAGGRGAGGGGGRGRAEVTPGSCCHCPAPCHSARAGPGIGSLAPLRTHLAFTYPGRAVER